MKRIENIFHQVIVLGKPHHGFRRAATVHQYIRNTELRNGLEHGGIKVATGNIVYHAGAGFCAGAGNTGTKRIDGDQRARKMPGYNLGGKHSLPQLVGFRYLGGARPG